VKQARLERLQALQRELTLAAHRRRVGEETEVLLEGPSRHGPHQRTGRDPYQRVVNLVGPDLDAHPPGSLVRVRIVEATPHSLLAEPLEVPARAA
jgi:tRNA A37 methylthiotransferase MiaB